MVGAGPTGCLAVLNAPAYKNILLIDRLKLPRDIICGGVVSADAMKRLDYLNPPEAVFSDPSRLHWSLYDWSLERGGPLTDRTYLNVNRAAFDSWLMEAATGLDNVQLWPSTSFMGLDDGKDGSVRLRLKRGGQQVEVDAEYIIGADGCASSIRKALGYAVPARWITVQETIRSQGVNVERFLAVMDDDIEHYGWVIPKGKNLLLGIGSSTGGMQPLECLRAFKVRLKAYHGIHGLSVDGPRARTVTRLRSSSDLIAGKGRILLAGEAAGLICPWSGEGITYAVRSGAMAGRSLSARTPLLTYRLFLKKLLPSIYFDLLGRKSMKSPWARRLIALFAPGTDFKKLRPIPD